MDVKLIGWESEGLRCPDAKIDLRMNGSLPQITLIQMPNGTGKTTTLRMLRTTLAGRAGELSPEEIGELARKDDSVSTGSFKVHLSVDDSGWTFITQFDFESGYALHQTSSPKLGGLREGYLPDHSFSRYLQRKFVDLFVFDGELARELLDDKNTRASEALEVLSDLHLVDDVMRAIDEYRKDQTASRANPSDTQFKKLNDKLRKTECRLAEVKAESTELSAEIDRTQRSIAELQQQIGDAYQVSGEVFESKREELSKRIQQNELDIRSTLAKTMSHLRSPFAYGDGVVSRLSELVHSLDELRLPENVSKQFFTELAERDTCVCGRPLTPETRNTITAQAEEYMGTGIQVGIANLKQQVANLMPTEQPHATRTGLRDSLSMLADKQKRLQQAEEELLSEMDKAGASQLLSKHNKMRELEADLRTYQARLTQIEEPDESGTIETTSSIPRLEKEKKQTEEKLAALTQTQRLHARTEALKSVLQRVRATAREKVKGSVVRDVNERLASVLPGAGIAVEDVDRSIRLQGQGGASSGQTLAVGYLFLLAALEHASTRFPLVVDSPANPLDHDRRSEIAELIPRFSEQFVAFVIPPERPGFVKGLTSRARSIDYLTLFRPGTVNEQDRSQASKNPNVTVFEDSILVRDKGYFEAFTSAETEE